jgi:CHAT domain-containing protein
LLDWPTKIEMLHLATHTRVRGDDPLNSSVELHQSKLTLAQLFKLPLSDHALVVLSSCRGGLGQNASASEPVSLASALAASGAQSVIANLWDADDEASKLFFSSFYAELRRHSDLSKAFVAAQKATRVKFPDPFYWAGFCLIGSPH